MKSSPSLSYFAVFINLSNRAKKQVRFYVLLMLIGLMAGAAITSASTTSFRKRLFSWPDGNEPFGTSMTLSDDEREAPTLFAAATAPIPLETQLNRARGGHTATLLTDGRVLIVGGEDANGFMTEAEILDPSTNTFSVSGNLSTPRADHTATRLSDGRVLIAGGRGTPGLLNSTEIFDPTTSAFTSGPNLIGARSGHSATLLNDGQIVVIGGDASGSVEIYIPLLNTFATTIANLSSPRAFHSAVLLNNGDILIVGGTAPDNAPVLSGEILNVTSSTMSAVANLTEDPHVRASLRVLPDGKVQIIGGSDHEDMEIYDLTTNQFGAHAHVFPTGDIHPELLQQIMDAQTRAAMFHLGASNTLLNRTGQTITELAGSNQALVTGGVDSAGMFLGSASLLNSSTATVTTDKLDYAPGTLVIVSGTGWQPNEFVTIMFHEDPQVATENPHTFTAQADTNGNFASQQYAPEDADHGITYILAAYGGSSGRTSQTAFTDAGPGSLGNYATVGLSGMSAPATVSPSNVATNVTFSTLSRGAGLSAAATSDAFNSSSWPPTYIAGNTDYYEFTIAPTFGYKFSASELRVGLQRSSSGPDKAELRSSLDSYSSTIGSLLSVGTGLATFTINLSSVSGLQNRTSPVTFRIYGYGATAAGGTLRIQRVTSPGMVGLEVDGTVAPLNSGTLQFSAANYPDAEANSGSHTKTITVRRTGGLDGAVSVHYATSDGTATTADNDYEATFGDLNWVGGDSADKTFTVIVHGDATYEENETVNLTLSAPTGGATIGGTNPATLTITNDDSAPSYTTTDNASATYGQTSVTLSATVSPSPGGGSIEFYIDGSSVGTGSVGSSGVATLNYNPSSLNAGSHTIRADFGGFAVYSASSSNPATNGMLTINKALIDPHITADNKTYNDATAATIATRSLTGVIGGDDVSLTGGSATFDTKDVGRNKTVTGTGLILAGTKAGNYQLSSTSATTMADITPATLTPAIVANDKVYDATISATLSSHTVWPVLGSDNVTLVVGTANFSDKNVGTGKTVTATGLTLSGANSGNYELSSTTTTDLADITTLHITGSFAAANKVYDGNNSATVLTRSLIGTVGGDDVGLTGGTATYDDANAGNGKTVTLAGATLAGADAGNYVVDSVSITSADLAKANATIVVAPYHVTYDAHAHTATGTATGVHGESLTGLDLSNTTHTDAGDYPTDAWTFTDATGNYNNASGTVHDPIDLASSTTTVNCPSSVTYDGTVQTPCTASVTRAGGLNEAMTVNYTNNTGAGTANASATYAGDANHENSTDSKSFEITKAISTTVVTCPASEPYTGSVIEPCTVSYSGAGGLSGSLTLTYSDNVNVGTTSASATYAGDANHQDSSDSKNFEITKATSTTVVTCPASEAYASSAMEPCTASYSGAGGLTGSLTLIYLNNVNVGTASASATYAGDVNHEGSSGSKNFEITKASSTTVLTCPASETYTGAAIEPCTASYSGAGGLSGSLTLTYSNNVKVGTASASATYAGDANHEISSDSKNFTIDPASSTSTVNCPGSVTYDGAAQTPCTASVTGAGGLNQVLTVNYTNNTDAGTANAYATYVGDVNHESNSDSKNFEITRATSTTVVTCPTSATFTGSAIEPCTASYSGAGGLSGSLTPAYSNNMNVGTATADATYSGDANHTGSTTTQVTFTITQAASTTTIDCPPGSFTYTGSAITPCTATVTRVGEANTTTTVTYADNMNVGTATADATYAGNANHTGSTATQITFTITPLHITGGFTADNKTYDGNNSATVLTRSQSGSITGDDVYLTGGTATFNDANAGTGKTVTLTGATLSGAGGANYVLNSVAMTTANISKANAPITVTPYNVIYDGHAHTATGTAKGVQNESLAGLDLSHTTHTDAGKYNNDPWTFTDITGNYSNINGTINDKINSSSTTTQAQNQSVTYSESNQSIPLTATVSGTTPANGGTVIFTVTDSLNNPVGSPVISGTLNGSNANATYTLPGATIVGNYAITAAYSGAPDFNASTGGGTLAVNPSDPLSDIATLDAEFKKIDGFDALFGKMDNSARLELKNTNPGTFHYKLMITNTTGAELNSNNGTTLRAFIEVPPMVSCGGVPCAGTTSNATPAFSLKNKKSERIRLDNNKDEMPVSYSYKSSGNCGDPAGYTSALPTDRSPRCIMVSGFTVPRRHRAEIDIEFEFRWKKTLNWDANANLFFFSGFPFKATVQAIFTNPAVTRTGFLTEGMVGAGQKVTAIGGFSFNSLAQPTTGLKIRLFNTTADATFGGACLSDAKLVAQDTVNADGFYFIWKKGPYQGTGGTNDLPDGIRYVVQVCNDATQLGSLRILTNKLGKKEFDEEDFYGLAWP
jgi:hypothetical protein